MDIKKKLLIMYIDFSWVFIYMAIGAVCLAIEPVNENKKDSGKLVLFAVILAFIYASLKYSIFYGILSGVEVFVGAFIMHLFLERKNV